MKTIAQCKLKPVWVNPDHMIETARYVLSGHKVRAVGVLRGVELVGTLSAEDLIGCEDDSLVRDAMVPVDTTVSVHMTIREAAQILSLNESDYLPVEENGQFRGIVTASMLLADMSRTWDPLTELPWSDLLRDWGVDQLKDGREISILFLDLDNFGMYNKDYGHTVGDRVLQAVAKRLRESVDQHEDVLVRYGGDEFAIGTQLLRADAEVLAQQIKQGIDGISIGSDTRPISISVGVFGGRRTHERENTHYAATIDNLINMASRNCMEAKSKKSSRSGQITSVSTSFVPLNGNGEPKEPANEPPLTTETVSPAGAVSIGLNGPEISEVFVDDRADRGVTMVTITVDGKLYRGVHARSPGTTVEESVAQATASAINRWDESLRMRIGDASIQQYEGHVDRVLIRGWATVNEIEQPVMGEAQAIRGLAFGTADAVLASLARFQR